VAVANGQELKEFDRRYLQSPPHGPSLPRAADEIARRTNEFRSRHSLGNLRPNPYLQHSAEYFAAYLARTDQFGHEADGNTPEQRANLYKYEDCIVAENIAYQMRASGFATSELAQNFTVGWENSPHHRENMLDPDITETGVAIGYSPGMRRYFAVQEFGLPKASMILFEVANRTPDTLHYIINQPPRDTSPPQSFELPPRGTMSHSLCRPATIDWGWTKENDAVRTKSGILYVITKSDAHYDVAETPLPQPNEPPPAKQ
jgi:uncharacterized protein YkwD